MPARKTHSGARQNRRLGGPPNSRGYAASRSGGTVTQVTERNDNRNVARRGTKSGLSAPKPTPCLRCGATFRDEREREIGQGAAPLPIIGSYHGPGVPRNASTLRLGMRLSHGIIPTLDPSRQRDRMPWSFWFTDDGHPDPFAGFPPLLPTSRYPPQRTRGPSAETRAVP